MSDFFILFDATQRERIIMLFLFLCLVFLYFIRHRRNLNTKVTLNNITSLILPIYTVFAGAGIGYAWVFKAKELSTIINNSELLMIAAIVLIFKGVSEIFQLFKVENEPVQKNES